MIKNQIRDAPETPSDPASGRIKVFFDIRLRPANKNGV